MSARRRSSAPSLAVAGARGRAPSPWGRDIVVGAQVTTFGRHGAGQPPLDGEVVGLDGQHVTIRDRYTGQARQRSISNVRLAGTASR